MPRAVSTHACVSLNNIKLPVIILLFLWCVLSNVLIHEKLSANVYHHTHDNLARIPLQEIPLIYLIVWVNPIHVYMHIPYSTIFLI